MQIKKLLVSLPLMVFVAQPVFAFPNVGDHVRYEGTFENKAVFWEFELVEYNAATGKFKQVDTSAIEGEAPETTQYWVRAQNLPSPENMKDHLAHCKAQGGKPETVTVKAGTFETCRSSAGIGGFANVGSVPFGTVLAKWVDADSGHPVTMELVSFKSTR